MRVDTVTESLVDMRCFFFFVVLFLHLSCRSRHTLPAVVSRGGLLILLLLPPLPDERAAESTRSLLRCVKKCRHAGMDAQALLRVSDGVRIMVVTKLQETSWVE